jgi:hypothetical protein
MVLLCKEMHWTSRQYRREPQAFVAALHSLLQNEAEAMNRKAKQ